MGTMTMARLVGLATLVLLAGCVAHEKNGDRAAALGDWRVAYAEYREALAKDPSEPALRDKYQQASREAVGAALRRGRGQACIARGDWACAVNEADFALSVDAGSMEAAKLRASATKGLALRLIAEAHDLIARGEIRAAWANVSRARATSAAADVAGELRNIESGVGAAARAEGERLLGTRAYPESIALLEIATQVDPTVSPRLEAARTEYQRFREEEHDRLCRAGDDALQNRQWSVAADAYRAAAQFLPSGRAGALAQYAAQLSQAEVAVSGRDWATASRSLRAAVQSQRDRLGVAAAMLDAVEVRPYAIRIKSVFVRPLRPDGRPWVGPPNPLLGRLFNMAASAVVPGVGTAVAAAVVDEAMRVPPENRPSVRVEVITPDGRRVTTSHKKTLYAAYDAQFVLESNQYDDRRLTFHVIGTGDRTDDVGAVDVRIGDLIRDRQATFSDQSLSALELAAERATSGGDGALFEMAVVGEYGNETATPSLAAGGTNGFKVVSVEAQGVLGDYQNELGFDGPPDLVVEIEQGGQIVYRSPKAQDQARAKWEPAANFLFVHRDEQLAVRVWDIDASDNDQIFAVFTPASALAHGEFSFTTQRNSWVQIRTAPRRVGP